MNTIRKNVIVIISIAILSSCQSNAQVGIGTNAPDPSAVLELKSTTQGFLLPRMTEVQMEAIATPVEGLTVYCLDCSPKGLYIHSGGAFESVITQLPSVFYDKNK